MSNWEIALLLTGASIAMIFFTYRGCITFFRMDDVLPQWAKQHGLWIIRKDSPIFSNGPFPPNRYTPVYHVTVEDEEHHQKTGWIRLGWWYIVGFKEHVEVRWEE